MTAPGIADVLADKRAELQAELAGLTAPLEPGGGSIPFGKRAGDSTSVAVERLSQVAAHERLAVLLGDVERAQVKVADGTYGYCDRCGSPIPPDRLEALPWAVRCMSCAGR